MKLIPSNHLRPFLLVLCLLMAAPLAFAAERYALVIGNSDYTGIARLRNSVNDATDMAASLRTLGFQVELLTNANLSAMEDATVRFGSYLARSKDSCGFFYYAGHGVQSAGVNYLIPVDAKIANEAFLKTKALSAQSVLDTMQAVGNNLNIVVLDACRDNPFGWSRSASRGLNVVTMQPTGSIIVYATSAGSVAQDGDGRNGLFTSQLLRHLTVAGLDISEVFRRTGASVMEASNNSQVPAIYSQFFQTAYLAGPPQGLASATPAPAMPTASNPAAPATPAASAKPAGPAAAPAASLAGPSSSIGLETVSIPGGSFVRDNARISVSPFLVGRAPVTQKQYAAIVGNNPSRFNQGFDAPRRPVEQVSWHQAVAFCNQLSLRDGLQPVYEISGDTVDQDFRKNGWRLPTEAEYAYLLSLASGGDDSLAKPAGGVAAWYRDTAGDTTHPVGNARPDASGLYDLRGNVMVWCGDWFAGLVAGDSRDPAGPARGTKKVLAGASWASPLEEMQQPGRLGMFPNLKDPAWGFRVLRRP